LEENKKYISLSKNNNNALNKTNVFSWKILNWLNYIIKKIFLPKTLKHYNRLWKPYWITISDVMLKFHNLDIRKEIAKK
jgi:hypothetical protein